MARRRWRRRAAEAVVPGRAWARFSCFGGEARGGQARAPPRSSEGRHALLRRRSVGGCQYGSAGASIVCECVRRVCESGLQAGGAPTCAPPRPLVAQRRACRDTQLQPACPPLLFRIHTLHGTSDESEGWQQGRNDSMLLQLQQAASAPWCRREKSGQPAKALLLAIASKISRALAAASS